jgi:hypothetical protein
LFVNAFVFWVESKKAWAKSVAKQARSFLVNHSCHS